MPPALTPAQVSCDPTGGRTATGNASSTSMVPHQLRWNWISEEPDSKSTYRTTLWPTALLSSAWERKRSPHPQPGQATGKKGG